MTKNALSNPVPYEHTPTETTPGIRQTFVGSIACVRRTMGVEVDAAWLMGTTGFAFMARAERNGHFGTVDWFDWRTVFPEALAQCGCQCTQVCPIRQADEQVSEAKLQEARAEIKRAIDAGTSVISFSICDMAWGAIVGYDDDQQVYDVLGPSEIGCTSETGTLTYGNCRFIKEALRTT